MISAKQLEPQIRHVTKTNDRTNINMMTAACISHIRVLMFCVNLSHGVMQCLNGPRHVARIKNHFHKCRDNENVR